MDQDDLEPKNSLIKQYQELFKLEGVKLTFKDNAVKEIAVKDLFLMGVLVAVDLSAK